MPIHAISIGNQSQIIRQDAREASLTHRMFPVSDTGQALDVLQTVQTSCSGRSAGHDCTSSHAPNYGG